LIDVKFETFQQKMENETELRVVHQEEQQREEGEDESQPQNPPPALRRRFVIYLYVGYFLARWSAR
jgi:iron-regulated transporter 1